MLDTDMASYVIKNRFPDVDRRLASLEPSSVCVSVITRAELMYGLKRMPADHRLQLGVRAFLRTVNVVPWGEDAADFYADIRHQLTTHGQPIGEMDVMIAAHSLAAAATLVTKNVRHFSRIIAPLMLENWVSST